MAVPYTFGSATTSIPLSQLDSNFATTITLGNTAVQLGNTITNLTGVSNVASATSLSLGSNGNTTAITVDTSQRTGFGTTAPISKITALGAGTINAPETTTTGASILSATYGITSRTGTLDLGSTDALAANTGGSICFSARYLTSSSASYATAKIGGYLETANNNSPTSYLAFATCTGAGDLTERMRIDSSGNLLVGRTSQFGFEKVGITYAGNNNWGLGLNDTFSNTSANTAIQFNKNGSNVGSITTTNSATAYVTSSDYRLKENIASMTDALNLVQQLKPVTYDWKIGGSSQGFIAHELQSVVPDCVVGEKDAVDADGNPKYQGIDTSFLVATLTAAIQELKAINDTQAETINALTARIVALEAK